MSRKENFGPVISLGPEPFGPIQTHRSLQERLDLSGPFKTLQEPSDHSDHLWNHFWTIQYTSVPFKKPSDPLRTLNQDQSGPIWIHQDQSGPLSTQSYP